MKKSLKVSIAGVLFIAFGFSIAGNALAVDLHHGSYYGPYAHGSHYAYNAPHHYTSYYDEHGYDSLGYDRHGFNKGGYHKSGYYNHDFDRDNF